MSEINPNEVHASNAELILRMTAVLRRSYNLPEHPPPLHLGGASIDFSTGASIVVIDILLFFFFSAVEMLRERK